MNQTYDGTERAVSVSTLPEGLGYTVTYEGTDGTVYPSTTTARTAAGT